MTSYADIIPNDPKYDPPYIGNAPVEELVGAYFALFPDYAWSGASEAIGVILRHAQELRRERDKLIELIRQSLSECVSDGGSDDPKIHPPEMSLLSRWNNAIWQTGKLPMECIRCSEPSGPLATIDDDSPGYICGDCYERMQMEEVP